MTAVLTNAVSGGTGNVALTADASVLASGTFAASSRVIIELVGDSLDRATIYEFTKEGGIVVAGKTGHTLYATVVGGDGSSESIDVSVLS